MKNIDEKASLCALGRIFGFEPKTALALISHCGDAKSIFRLGKDELEALLGPYSRHRGEICPEKQEEAYRELTDLQSKGIRYIGFTEENYPEILKECEDPPVGLYIRSETPEDELWIPSRKISIVGTRDISPYGKEWCERIVRGLASSGEKPMIVSGLALGTDICAHRTALECGLPTIGVMATGPECIYPYRNEGPARQMVRTPGCALVTDYPPGTAPLAVHFLRRNRIIAGLSQATILVESKIRGGGMMTSRLAFSYNRDVYALPGRADDLRSQGCNRLIREKVAEPLTSIEELLDSIGMKAPSKSGKLSAADLLHSIYSGTMEQKKVTMMHQILDEIIRERGISIEEIAESASLPYHLAGKLCNIMESDGLISIDLLGRCSIRAKNF